MNFEQRKRELCKAILSSQLGDEALVAKWLVTPNKAFEGEMPVDLPVEVVLKYLQGLN
jgi:hypothetical protein